jgi:hypothetical protein
MANPAIKDTTLVLTGHWRLTPSRDSILLICSESRIIDTALNILTPKDVAGQTVPMFVNISRNTGTNDIEWDIALSDLVPLTPLLGINLSGIHPSVLQVVRIILVKKSQ